MKYQVTRKQTTITTWQVDDASVTTPEEAKAFVEADVTSESPALTPLVIANDSYAMHQQPT